MRVAFDFDGTLCVDGKLPEKMWSLIQFHKELGDEVVIVTSRNWKHEKPEWYLKYEPDRVPVWGFVENHCLGIKAAIFTNHKAKGPVCKANGIDVLYDDNQLEIDSCNKCGVEGVFVDQQATRVQGYVRQ